MAGSIKISRPWPPQCERLTVDDVIAGGACASGAYKWLLRQPSPPTLADAGDLVSSLSESDDERRHVRVAAGFVGDGYGYGYGYGDGDGDGDGDGYGDGDGDGYGDGDGDGDGDGGGRGHGY